MMASPSMVHRTGDTLVVRSVVSGDPLFHEAEGSPPPLKEEEEGEVDELMLPQCKIKRNYTCTHCTYYTQNPRSYLYHLKDVHKEKIRVYECPNCLYASKHSQKLQRHVHMVHVMGKGKAKRVSKESTSNTVPKAKKAAAPKNTLLVPKLEMDIDMETEEICEENGARDDEASKMQTGDGEYKCSICNFTNKSKSLVSRHEHVVHLKKKFFRCSKCNYVTHMRARYTKHVKYHSMPMIKCDLCDFRTPYKWNLDRHYKNHTGDGAFRCSLCNFTADIKQSLTVHEMNHHVPPVGQAPGTIGLGAGGGRRRNKVGASDTAPIEPDIDQDELELLRLEREDGDDLSTPTRVARNSMPLTGSTIKDGNRIVTPNRRTPKMKITVKKMKSTSTQEQNERHNFRTDFIHPDDIIHHKNGNVYIKNIKCRVCNFKAAWEGEMARHENKVHGIQRPTVPKPSPKKVSRPIPNLIPIQNKPPTSSGTGGAASTLPILRIPSVRARSTSLLKHQTVTSHVSLTPSTLSSHETSGLSEKDLNEICAKSCPNSSLKDFASLIGGEDAFKTSEDVSEGVETSNKFEIKDETVPAESYPNEKSTLPPGTFKKKNASFFDKLKEKLLVGAGAADTCNLVCAWCGHESKCLSELVRHQKHHTSGSENGAGDGTMGPGTTIIQPSGAELSSTRCQRCRQRCKTSADLVVHLQSCTASVLHERQEPEVESDAKQEPKINSENKSVSEAEPKPLSESEQEIEPHPMENKVFVWNSLPQPVETESEDDPSLSQQLSLSQQQLLQQQQIKQHQQQDEDSRDTSVRSKSPISDGSLVGVETTPGYGAVTSKANTEIPEMTVVPTVDPETSASLSVKKVFKCPHCSFWASTASRFHVHIVGHLNKKPFECSLCAYRSNWRWDITKHIRLKSARDVSHERARVLMTDETGRRNYSKYNKFLTLMRVHEPNAESSGSGRRSRGEPSQGTATTCEGGIIQQQPLPAPPRLTRAPNPVARSNNLPPLVPGTLRPPPPLRAAHQVVFPGPPPLQPQQSLPSQQSPSHSSQQSLQEMDSLDERPKRVLKRPAKMLFDQEPPPKRPSGDGKKTLWKCKKCNYRDSSRELVLAHVKEHYQQRLQAHSSTPDSSERHCRLKHSGDVRVVMGQRNSSSMETTTMPDPVEEESGKPFTCDSCPFTTMSESELANHQDNHTPQPGAVFKCYFCPYYVTLKNDLLQHMKLHGVTEPEEYLSKAMKEKLIKTPTKSPEKESVEGTQQLQSGDLSPTKRYKCVGCPYVSNSKSQFLYHKQFHRPRGAPFKCGLCSYNVSRRHLLHQHLRVHGILIPPQKSPTKSGTRDDGADEIEEVSVTSPQPLLSRSAALDTRTMVDIPLVWVSRGGKFSKMYKCRYCPHVNLRKANIQEHEKMHRVRTKNNSASREITRDSEGNNKEPITVPSPTVQQHRCPDCNYICNNAGVLSSHAKVHQGLYGQVHCLVDASRSDEAQLEELNATLMDNELQTNMSLLYQQEDAPDIEDVQDDIVDFHLDPSQPSKDDSLETTMNTSEVIVGSITDKDNAEKDEEESKVLYFCSHCPARFLYKKELSIHVRFHEIRLAHRCESCTYTARQRPYLLAHLKVHTDDYQEKTNALVNMYPTSPEHPRPRSAVIVEGPGVSGPVWVVISGSTQVNASPVNESSPKKSQDVPTKSMFKQFSCTRCPARFFKSVALQYHISLHGGAGLYRCRHCDYAVKTYGNLVKHEMIHDTSATKVSKSSVSKNKNGSGTIPISGTDLFQHKSEAQKRNNDNNMQRSSGQEYSTLHVDPQFGILMHGNPDFIYPMYFKNGRLKEKRYKCHKCPSAFEKREQYKVHLSLHGSKQRYKCEKCDYSVKYYANYIQHMRKHQNNEEALAARKLDKASNEQNGKDSLEDNIDLLDDSTPTEEIPPQMPRSMKTIGGSPSKQHMHGSPRLSLADQQTMMLLQQRRSSNSSGLRESSEEILRKTFWCPHCPYSSQRRDGVENHVKRHVAVSGIRGNYICAHCDYSAPQLHFLREHNKVHFGIHKKFVPEAYMKCDRIELWVQDEGKENITETASGDCESQSAGIEVTGKRLVFQDNGTTMSDAERFYPLLPQEVLTTVKDEEDEEKVYIDLRTGESVAEASSAEMNGINENGEETAIEERVAEAEMVPDEGSVPTNDKIDADDGESMSATSTDSTSSAASTSSSSSSSSTSSSSSSSTSTSSSSASTGSSTSTTNEDNKSVSSSAAGSEESTPVNNQETKSIVEDAESTSNSSNDS